MSETTTVDEIGRHVEEMNEKLFRSENLNGGDSWANESRRIRFFREATRRLLLNCLVLNKEKVAYLRRFQKTVSSLQEDVALNLKEIKELKDQNFRLKRENARLHDQVERLQQETEDAVCEEERVGPLSGDQAERPNFSRQPTNEPEQVPVNDFMDKILENRPYDSFEGTGPWRRFIPAHTYFELDNSQFSYRSLSEDDLKGYVKIYGVHPELCPHTHFRRLIDDFKNENPDGCSEILENCTKFLKPIIREVWVKFPLEETVESSLCATFQEKITIPQIQELIYQAIPLPPLIHTSSLASKDNNGAIRTRNSVPIFVPDDATFEGAVFAEFEFGDSDCDDADFYPGLAPSLDFSHYKIPELRVPRYNVEFPNGEVEEFVLSDLIPIEVVPSGTPLIWRLKNNAEKTVIFEKFEKRSDEQRPPLFVYSIHAWDVESEQARMIPLTKVCMKSEIAYQIQKKLRTKLLSTNKACLLEENILPTGTKRARTERVLKEPSVRKKIDSKRRRIEKVPAKQAISVPRKTRRRR